MAVAAGVPQEVAARRQRFIEAGGALPAAAADRALLEAILASGEFLPELLLADVGAFARLAADPCLRRAKSPEAIARDVRAAAAGVADLAGLQQRLRRIRRYEMLRLGARELGWGTTDEVARELSAFADACLDVAVEVCDRELRAELGEPRADDGSPVRFVVIAMGKLGGEELNFSSDVDVCYFYSTDAGAAGEASLHHYYAELSRRVSAALEQPTGDGMVFRVDLRLRPEGRNGPLCNSIAAAETYYETFGRTWERQAWLRARPAAGDRALGDELLSVLEPFIYPRSVDARLIDDVRGLRALFRDPADAGGALGETGFDVKLGAGGIRDVEMVVQALQLLNAGKRPDLRERNTPRAFPRLVVAGLLGDREAWTLLSAYRFWRRLEHRVQVGTGAQHHRIPGDDDARARFAAGLGFASLAAFDAEVRDKRAAVEAIAATLGEPPPEMDLDAARLLDPLRDRVELERLATAAGFRDAEAAVDTLEAVGARLPAALLGQIIVSPDPDRALLHFRDLIWRSSDALMLLLRDEPQLARMLAALFGSSDRLAELLVRHPPMWDALVEGLGARVRTPAELAGAARGVAARPGGRPRRGGGGEPARDPPLPGGGDAADRAARRGGGSGARRGRGRPDGRGGGLPGAGDRGGAARADGALRRAARRVDGARPRQPGRARDALRLRPRPGVPVRRRGREHDRRRPPGVVRARVAAVHRRDGDDAGGGAPVQGRHAAAPVGRAGAAGDVVERVRALPPRRGRGLGAGGAAARARRLQQRGARACVRQREGLLRAIAFDRPFDQQRFVADLRRVRAKVESERGRVPEGSRHLRFDPGGIMDVEFLVALGQLANAADDGVRTTTTGTALARLVALGWPESLLDDYAALRRATLRLRLLLDRPEDVVSPRDLPMLARSLGTSPEALAADLDARLARVRAVFDDRFA